jgi:hypothetical protein
MKVYDSDIRALLFDSFLRIDEYICEDDTIVVNEMDVCAGVSRADIAVINGKIHGYEIKSGQDNLERLPYQIESYNQVFDTMTIVAHENHLDKLHEVIPEWWGIQYVSEKSGQIYLCTERQGKQNEKICIQSVAMLLWRDEMIELIITRGENIRTYKNKSRKELSKLIAESIECPTISDYVRQTLKTRVDWKAVQLQQLSDDLRCTQPN